MRQTSRLRDKTAAPNAGQTQAFPHTNAEVFRAEKSLFFYQIYNKVEKRLFFLYQIYICRRSKRAEKTLFLFIEYILRGSKRVEKRLLFLY